MQPSIFSSPNDFVFVIEVIKAYFTFSCTSKHLKSRLIHSAGLTVVNKEVVPSLFVCFYYMMV